MWLGPLFQRLNMKLSVFAPGEKLHEQMIGFEDALHTYEYAEHYKVLSAIHNWSRDPSRISDGKLVTLDFT